MATITVSKKEYTRLLKRQEKVEWQVQNITRIIQGELADEVTDAYKKRLERWSREMDKGAGKRFHGIQEVKKYFKHI